VFFHFGLPPSGGFVGVDVFFVISGFLITSILWSDLEAGRYSILHFYERRIRRIFPALFVMLGVSAVLAWGLMIPSHLEEFGESAVAASVFLSNIYFYLQEGYFTEAAEIKPLLHTWSLAVEEQYYIFFPPFLWGLGRLASSRMVMLVLSVLALISLMLAMWTLERNPSAAFYLPQSRVWELLLGSVAAIAVAEGWITRLHLPVLVWEGVALTGLALIVWANLAYTPATAFPALAALPPCLGAALILLCGSKCKTLTARFLSLGPVVFTGKISYSWYLWHWPIVVFYNYVSLEPLTLVQIAFGLTVSFVLAVLSWRFVEQPFRQSLYRPRVSSLTAAVAVVATIAMGLAFNVQKGLPARLPPDLLTLLDSQTSRPAQADCHLGRNALATPGPLCIRGAEGASPDFVFAGDSHAGAISAAVFEAAARNGRSGYQYTGYGFRPLIGTFRRGYPEEGKNTERFVSFLKDNPQIKTVLLTGYWLHQATGYSYRHHGDLWTDEDYDGTGTAYNAKALRHGLDRLVTGFPDRRFLLLDDVPSGEVLDLRSAVRILWYDPDRSRDEIGLPATDYARQRKEWEPILADLSMRHDNVAYKPIFKAFCDPDLCPLFVNGQPMFRDGDHLSQAGAERLIPELQVLMRP
jgi:peptidoglycan/LPS O-acetylase OafA/YrhL